MAGYGFAFNPPYKPYPGYALSLTAGSGLK